MAHGKIKIDFTSKNINDLKFLEIIVYIVILSELGITDDNIIKKSKLVI